MKVNRKLLCDPIRHLIALRKSDTKRKDSKEKVRVLPEGVRAKLKEKEVFRKLAKKFKVTFQMFPFFCNSKIKTSWEKKRKQQKNTVSRIKCRPVR